MADELAAKDFNEYGKQNKTDYHGGALMLNAVIDLSHHNGPVDLARAKADGVLGVIHKCTQGISFSDSQFTSRKNLAAQLGILFGAYHFGDGTDGATQAGHFLASAGDAPLLVLDFEENTLGASMELGHAYDFIRRRMLWCFRECAKGRRCATTIS